MSIILNIGISALTVLVTVLGVWNYMPLGWLGFGEPTVGTTITSLNTTDQLSDFPTLYNTNNTAMNAGKIEISTTTLPLITTLLGLSSVGTITTGTWNATAIGVSKGGTGTTTFSSNQVLLGNTTSGIKTVNGWGTSGQFLTSAGGTSAPTWTTSSIDSSLNYTWTGEHVFNNTSGTTTINSATTTLSSATTTWTLAGAVLGVGTSTPSALPQGGMCIASDVYIAGGLGVGMATTSDGNLRVSQYAQIDRIASTTDLYISGSQTGGRLAYAASSTAGTLTAGKTFTGSIPAIANWGIIKAQVGNSYQDLIIARTIKTASTIGDVGDVYTLTWSGSDLVVTEDAGAGTLTFTAYWYR